MLVHFASRTPWGQAQSQLQDKSPLAQYIADSLVKKKFDIANLTKFEPRGGQGSRISHMVYSILPALEPSLKIPMVPVFMNEYFPPLPTAERCYELGEALRDILGNRPKRIVICGGLIPSDGRKPKHQFADRLRR